MSILKAESVNIVFNNKVILDKINFKVENGLTVILSPNKCEKSVLIRSLATLLKINSGDIILDDLSYRKDNKKIRKYLGYVQDEVKLYPQLTGKQLLEIIYEIKYEEDRNGNKIINNLIKLINEEEKSDDYINNYNQLTKAKFAIAQAILGESKLVLIDSILNGLEVKEKKELMEIIKLISKDRIVILTSNDIDIIENYYDNIIIINDGIIKFNSDRKDINKESLCDIYNKYTTNWREEQC